VKKEEPKVSIDDKISDISKRKAEFEARFKTKNQPQQQKTNSQWLNQGSILPKDGEQSDRSSHMSFPGEEEENVVRGRVKSIKTIKQEEEDAKMARELANDINGS
jgi:hypothetical protein